MAIVSVVTGANSGIGRATAIHLASRGHEVYGTVRDEGRADKMKAMAAAAGVEVNLVAMDVADDDSVRKGIGQVLERAGQVDVLVNNAGVGSMGSVEETPPDEFLSVMNVNLCGALRCTQAVLPGMKERGHGAIVNITSIAGRFASPGQAAYVASKWAFEGVSEELAFELAPFGIRVVIVEPGVTKSAIFAKTTDLPEPVGGYDDLYRRLLGFYAAGIAHATDPFEVGEVIYNAVTTDSPQLRYVCSFGGNEVLSGRARISDEEFVALGAVESDKEYADRFAAIFGVRPLVD